MASERVLAIRADANRRIGTGHVMRCLALAHGWQDSGGRAVAVMGMEAPAVEARLQSEGVEVVHLSVPAGSDHDAVCTAELARKIGASCLVVDGYHFHARYQRIIKDSGLRLLFIDDYGHADHYSADVVVNQNLHAHEALYPNKEPYTQLLLGTRYVLLRREFLQWRGWKREASELGRKVLVTVGGSDPDNATLKVITALQQIELKGLEAVIVVGGSNPHYEALQSAVRNSPVSIVLKKDVTDMPELMAWAEVGISAAGTTSWELAFMGLPSVLLIQSENQCNTAERLAALGVARNLGASDRVSRDDIARELTDVLTTVDTRVDMARRGRELVDGKGINRVLQFLGVKQVSLRRADDEDAGLIWKWANDSEVRAVSFSSDPIPWEEHVRWFESKLEDTHCVFYIAVTAEGGPLGQVRYEINGDDAVISIALDAASRGMGYGASVLKLACQKLFEESTARTVHAYIKVGNEASARAFVKAGFKNAGESVVCGQRALHLFVRKEEFL